MHAAFRRVLVGTCTSLLMAAGCLTAAVRAQEQGSDSEHVVTFTKWITVSPGYPIMAGVTGGAAAGTFTGQVLEATTTVDGLVQRLVAVYEVHSGAHSFIALIQGGGSQGAAILDGRVLSGWLTGARVRVNFETISCAEPNALAGVCFQGTIRLSTDHDEQ
jgi:hypothetical protein